MKPLPLGPEQEDEEQLERLSRRAHALSDPIRLRMIDLMVRAQACCRPTGDDGASAATTPRRPPDRPDPASRAPAGVCVCELQSLHGLAQSTVSYHLKVLREAGLVREDRRGKWSFYSIDEETADDFAAAVRRQLGL